MKTQLFDRIRVRAGDRFLAIVGETWAPGRKGLCVAEFETTNFVVLAKFRIGAPRVSIERTLAELDGARRDHEVDHLPSETRQSPEDFLEIFLRQCQRHECALQAGMAELELAWETRDLGIVRATLRIRHSLGGAMKVAVETIPSRRIAKALAERLAFVFPGTHEIDKTFPPSHEGGWI